MLALGELCVREVLARPSHSAEYRQKAEEISAKLLAEDPRSADGVRLQGFLAMADGQAQKAIELFQRAIKAGDLRAEVQLALVQNLLLDGRESEAVKAADDLIARQGDYFPVYDILYGHYLRKGEPELAQRVLERKVANNPRQALYLLQLSEHHLHFGHPDKAAQLLDEITSNPSLFPDGRLQVGDFHGQSGNWLEAIRNYEQGIAERPQDKALFQRRIAAARLRLGQASEARKTLDDLIRETPNDIDGRIQRGSLLMATGASDDASAAIQDFEAARAISPKDPAVLLRLGQAQVRRGDLDGARKSYMAAAEFGPPSEDLVLALAELSVRQNRLHDAVQYADGLLRGLPGHRQALLIRAVSRIGLGDLALARGDLETLRNLSPASPESEEAQLLLGMLALAKGKHEEAEAVFQKLHRRGSPDTRALQSLALAYTSSGRAAQAVALLEAELVRRPESAELSLLLLRALAASGQRRRAVDLCRDLMLKNPKSAEVHRLHGQLLLGSGDAAGAVPSLRQAVKLAPEDSGNLPLLAVALQHSGNLKDAERVFEDAVRLRPDDAVLLNNYAYFLAELGSSLDRALAMAQKARLAMPRIPQFADTVGWIHMKRGEVEPARQIFESLVRNHPENQTFRYHLGLTALEAGDKRRAREELGRALDLDPQARQAVRIRELLERLK
jgi:tetratricopeptide (TPR) repeat protein